MEETKKSVYEVLSAIDCSQHIEERNGLSYLSWAWAWGILKKYYPDAVYTIYENQDGLNYFTDGRTCFVKTGVTVQNLEYIEYLPVMDHRNASIPLEKVTSFDVNKAIQRSLTKAIARHGLGLYVYAGEDLPMAASTYKPCSDERYADYLAKEAAGEILVSKSGKKASAKAWWITETRPDDEAIRKFDHDVELWKAGEYAQIYNQ